jgi:hypothetical protein
MGRDKPDIAYIYDIRVKYVAVRDMAYDEQTIVAHF